MQKRGTSQIDWAISLSLFILYIAWFFIFISPNINYGFENEILYDMIENHFYDNFTVTTKKLPLFLTTYQTQDHFPIIINSSEYWTDSSILDTYSFKNQGRLFFLLNSTSEKNIIYIIDSNSTMTEKPALGISVQENWSTTYNMGLQFSDSMITSIFYDGNTRLNNTYFMMNNNTLNISIHNFTDAGILAKYTGSTGTINHTSYIFAKNSIIQNYIDTSNKYETYWYFLSFSLSDYTSYYTDNQYYGTLNYGSESKSISYSSEEITFYDDTDSFTLCFDHEADLAFSYYNSTIKFNATLTIKNSTSYKMIFHPGNYTDNPNLSYASSYGMLETKEGLSYTLLKDTNYSQLKNRWEFPDENGFKITIWNSTIKESYNETTPILEIGPNTTMADEIFAKDTDTYMLDDFGITYPINVNIKVW